ncbi:TipAS antibiotic-recognition domain-containing protein [Nocardia sp. NPDC059239]|uniref:TipAS antibiotic-recognition domain-containing protein n=1 Tax=unclassified Nocardia TaxID=2637762 RepID=UPI003684E334
MQDVRRRAEGKPGNAGLIVLCSFVSTNAPSPEVQAIVARHAEWVREGWQGRSWGGKPFEEAFAYLGEMYVSDERFRAGYDIHGAGTTEFARDAMAVYGRAHS